MSLNGLPSFYMYCMQLVTPSEVQSAVSTVTMTCRIVFQVSFFISFFLSFLVNNLVSVSRHPSLGRGMIHLFVSEPHQWFSLTMQRYNIFRRNAIVVPAVVSGCPGSCDVRHEIPFDRAAVSCVATQEILRGDVVIATWRRRNYDVATLEKVNEAVKKWTKWTVNLVNLMKNEYLLRKQWLRMSYIIMYARSYYYLFLQEIIGKRWKNVWFTSFTIHLVHFSPGSPFYPFCSPHSPVV